MTGDAASDCQAPELRYPVLLLREGIDVGAVFSLEHGSLLVGRDRTASVAIGDPEVSRIHARIFRRLDGWYVEDLGSASGIRVRGLPVERARTEDGDVIEVGPAASLVFTMVTRAQEAALRGLYEADRTDAATGALQPRHYDHQLAAGVERAVQADEELSVLRIRLDGYDRLLALWGTESANVVLGHLAATIRQRVSMGSVLARLKEAEFALLLPGTKLAHASRAAERLRIAIATARPLVHGLLIPLSISVGVSSLKCGVIPTCSDVMEIAGRRLQQADLAGGDRVVASG